MNGWYPSDADKPELEDDDRGSWSNEDFDYSSGTENCDDGNLDLNMLRYPAV